MLVSLVVGLSIGSIYGLTAMGLVLTYRTSGIFNLAHGAMGMLGTYVFWQLWQEWGWPMVPSAAVALLAAAPLIGIAVHGLVFRWVRGRPIAVTIVAGIAVTVALQGLASKIWSSIFRVLPSVFPFRTFGLTKEFNVTSEQLGTMAVTLVLALLLLWYLNGTRFGLRTRAVVDNAELAEVVGNPSERIQMMSWVVASMMSTLSGMLISPFIQLSPIGLTLVVIQAMAAAVIGRLRSLPLTYAGGLAIGVLEATLARYLPASEAAQGLKVSAAFLVLYAAVVLGTTVYRAFDEGTSEEGTLGILGREVQPARLLPLLVIFAGLAVAIPNTSSYTRFLISSALVLSIAFQGFVLVVGQGGQVILCQAAFMGVGALLFARMVSVLGWPYLLAALVAPLAALLFGLAISIPAVRIRGLPLALLGLAFGLFADAFVFRTSAITGGFAGFTVNRPELFGIDLRSDEAFAWVCLGVAFVVALGVRNLCCGRSGRAIVAAKNSQLATESLGTSVRMTKLVLFCLASLLGGIAGVLSALQIQTVGAIQFNVFQSLTFLAVAILGGVGNAQGAVIGALLLNFLPEGLKEAGLLGVQELVFGLGAALVLRLGQGGVGDMVSRWILTLAAVPDRVRVEGRPRWAERWAVARGGAAPRTGG